MSTVKTNLLNFDRRQLADFFVAWGEKPFRATQLLQWIYQEGVLDFTAMTNLSKGLRQRLLDECELRMPEVALEQRSHDGTCKWLLRLDSGNCIETVFIPEANRGTLCVSSQIGCALECSFCSTAQQGFNRNLTAAEIIAQVMVANQALGYVKGEKVVNKKVVNNRVVTNVVLMGMGEPLLNFDNVVTAINIMLDDFAFGLSKRRVTLSTAGVVPALDRLKEVSDISLAVSLHAPTDALRDELVPLNRKYPIAQLLAACMRYVADSNHRAITFEYVMLDGINDSPQHAKQLVALLQGIPAKVNLIPFNPFPEARYRRSPQAAIDQFRDIVVAAGYPTMTRKTRGDDIDAACGQLAGKVMDRTKRRLRREEAAKSEVVEA